MNEIFVLLLGMLSEAEWYVPFIIGIIFLSIFNSILENLSRKSAIVIVLTFWLVLDLCLYAYIRDDGGRWNNSLILLSTTLITTYFITGIVSLALIGNLLIKKSKLLQLGFGLVSVFLVTFFLPLIGLISSCYVVGDCL